MDGDQFAPPVPEAVRRQAQRAEQLAAEIHNGSSATVADPPADEPPAEPQTPAPAPAQPAPQGTPDWEQRYNTLQGKYNAEVAQLQAHQRAANQQIQQLQQMLATLQAAPPRQHEPPAPAQLQPQVNVDLEQDIKDYGEVVAKARQWARMEMKADLDEMRRRQDELAAKLGDVGKETQQVRATSAMEAVKHGLSVRMPDWEATNNDPAFFSWLQEIDRLSNRKRHDMLTEAFMGGDTERTLGFFQAFRDQAGQTVARPSLQPQAHTPDNGAGRVPLEELAAPGRGVAATGAQGAQNKRIWKRDDITAFYQDVTKGIYRNRDADKARVERDLHDAMSEGRIRD